MKPRRPSHHSPTVGELIGADPDWLAQIHQAALRFDAAVTRKTLVLAGIIKPAEETA